MMKMKDGARINHRNKTSSDELQRVLTLDSRKHDKRIIVEWFLGKNHCAHYRGDPLNFLLENLFKRCSDDCGVQGIQIVEPIFTIPSPPRFKNAKPWLGIRFEESGNCCRPDKGFTMRSSKILTGKITSDDTPEGISSDRG